MSVRDSRYALQKRGMSEPASPKPISFGQLVDAMRGPVQQIATEYAIASYNLLRWPAAPGVH